MSFTYAIQSAFERYFDVSGRASRTEHASFLVFCVTGAMVLTLVDALLFGTSLGLPPLTLIFGVITLAPFVTVMFRRLHDTNRNGWWLVAFFVPIVGWLALLFLFSRPGTTGANAYGLQPSTEDGSIEFAAAPAE